MDLNPDLKNETELTAPTKITLNPATLLAPIPVVLLSCRGYLVKAATSLI